MRLSLTITLFLILSVPLLAQRVSGPTLHQPPSPREIAFEGQIIFAESFDNGQLGELPTGWNSFSLSGEAFFTGTAGSGVSQSNESGFWPVPFHGIFAMTNDDVCNCDKSNDRLRSRKIDLSGMQSVQIGFSAFQNGSAGQTAHVEIRATGLPWSTLLEIPASSLWEEYRSFIPQQYLTADFQFRFVYSDNGFYASGLAIDDVFLGIGTEQNLAMKELYTIEGNDGGSADFYQSLPWAQARRADLKLGALIENNSFAFSNARLETFIAGPIMRADTLGDWLLYPLETNALSLGNNQQFTPKSLGSYNISGSISSDSLDLIGGDNAQSFSFDVSDSVYQRHHGDFDGTGIWLLETPERLGLVYHLFQDDTVKTLRIAYHPSCTPNSRYRIKVYSYDGLTSSLFPSSPIIIEEDEIGETVDVPVNFDLEAGKYLFVIERELGRVVISSNQRVKARNGNVLIQKPGQQWKPFPYVPFVSLVMPVDANCSDFIEGTVNHVSCPGVNDGNITVALNSGIADTYEWSFVNGNNPNAENLSGGTYSVTITDVVGCQYARSFVLPEPDTIRIEANVAADTCSQVKGVIVLSVVGGSGPLAYDWSNGFIKPEIENLTSGTYTVTVTDANGCTQDSSFVVEGSSDFDVAVYIEQPGCGNSNGLLAPDVLGGIGNFDFVWSTGSTNDTLQNLTAGIYTVTVYDSVHCAEVSTINLNDSNSATLSIANQTNVLCSGSSTGALQVLASGNGPFSYSWSNGASTDAVSNLPAGNYSVTVADMNLCQSVLRATITETARPLVLDLDARGILCNGDSNGLIRTFVSGGLEPYTYAWNTGSSDNELSDLLAGHYVLTVTDGNGCSTLDSSDVAQLPLFFISVDSIQRLNDTLIVPDGAIYTSAFGGTPPYRYNWSNGSTSPEIVALDSGMYSLTVTDQLGCQRSITEVISKYPVGIITSTFQASTSIYPNPVRSNSTLTIQSDVQIRSVTLFNSEGQKVVQQAVSSDFSIQIPEVPASLYFLEIEFSNGNKEYKHLIIIE